MVLSFSRAAELPLLQALIGLARAADASAQEQDEAIFSLLREGLSQLEGPEPSALLARIHEKKARLIPGCMACASPCGRTAEPTAADLLDDEPAVLDRKKQILGLARALVSKSEGLCLLQAVFALGEHWTLDQLDTLIQTLQ